MSHQSHVSNPVRSSLARIVASPVTRTVSLLALCAAYIQGPLAKIFDFNSALAEMDHFGLQPAAFFAVAVIAFELAASAMVVSGFLRWAGAWRWRASHFSRPSSLSASGKWPRAWIA